MHKSQVLFYLLLAFLGGVFVASFLPISQAWILVFLIVAIGLIAISGYLPRTKSAPSGGGQRNYLVRGQKTYSKKGLLAGALALVFIFGIIRFNSFNFANSILNQFVGTEVILNGYIDDEPDVNGIKLQFIFKAKELIVPDRIFEINERTLVRTNSFPKRKFGDKLSVTGSLQTPKNFKDFDYIQYLKNKNIRTIISFPKIDPVRSLAHAKGASPKDLGEDTSYGIEEGHELKLGFETRFKIALYGKLFQTKELFENVVNRSLPEPYGGYINGILLGSRQDIPQSIKDAFNKTSTTHVLAISGYNITIIADSLLGALVIVMRRRRAFWVSVIVILLFTILTGASASVVRAATMGLLLLIANGYGRLYDARNGIALAAGLMVFFNPFVLIFDIGFQLSFLAVLGLVYVYPTLKRKVSASAEGRMRPLAQKSGSASGWKKLPETGGLKESLLMTISAQTLVFPLIIYYFKQFSLVSLLANILVLPLMPLTMLFGFLTGVGGIIFAPLGRAIGLFAWGLGLYQLTVIKWFGSLSFAAISIVINWSMLFVIYGFIVYGIWKLNRNKK